MRRPTTPVFQKEVLPQLAPFGIMSPATNYVVDNNDNWLDGYTYTTPDARIFVAVGDMMVHDTDTDNLVVDNPEQDIYREVKPANIRVEIIASTMAMDYDDLEDTIKSVLPITIQKAVEREFWNGAIASVYSEDNRWLDESQAVDHSIGGTGVKPKVGVALLEQALADATIGSHGCLHMPRGIATLANLKDDKSTLYTKLKTPVVAGTGYQMNSDGVSAWVFGTGPVTVRQGKPIVIADESESLDRVSNTFKIVLNVPASVTWSTSTLHAVQVNLTLDN